jgi:signal transduction histidine kinase/CheY-like chemotaxis protein
MNVKNRTLLIVSLVILALSCFLLNEGISHFNEEIEHAIHEKERIIDGVTNDIKQYSLDSYLFKIRYLIEQNEHLRQALADRDRDLLYQLALPRYQFLQGENPYFLAMDFNLPDGTVFLRVQNPELYGDNISTTRPLVLNIHKDRQQRSGFDVCKHGALFWVAQPIVHQGEYLGLVEFGIDGRQLEKALAESLASDVTSVLKVKAWQKDELARQGFQVHSDYALMTHNKSFLDQIAGSIDFSRLEDQRVVLNGKPHILHSCALLQDYQKDVVGRMVMLQDISEQVTRKRTFILHTLLLTVAMLAVAFVVLYYSFEGLIGRLEEYSRENKKAKEELQIAHDKLEDRVKERTVDLAKTNARLEDEVTIRRRAEERHDQQRAFLETIIESMTNPFYVIDAESYAIIMANKAARSLTGAETSQGLTCYRLTHHAERPCASAEHPCPMDEVKRTGKPVVFDHVHYGQDKKPQYVEVCAYPIFDPSGKVIQVVEYTLDITERKRSDEEREKLRSQLLASQKMETVGILAGGIAHDFNNILTTILGYSQIMALKLKEPHPMREMANEIYDAADRAASLTRQLLAFSRKQVMEIKIVNLNTIVANISKMLGRLIGENIQLHLTMAEPLGNIWADAGQIEQVIMNLVVNARDAMPAGGTLTIETGRIELDEKYTASRPEVQPGLYAMITVTDTGVGIPPEIQDKIFEPFFTTKKRGEGTGLGLSTVYGIVKQHNGHIYVYSEPGRGTTFKIYLPMVEGKAEETGVRESRSMPLGSETILVVDDDASIRHLLRDTLEPLGYSLIEAGSGEDALALLGRTGAQVHLVLTDLIMPGMNGQELLDAIKVNRPAIKSVIMSGYTDKIVIQHGILKTGENFINKPLLPIALANKIREVLDAA